MRIAISSDNHLDINRVDVEAAAVAQAAYLREQNVDYYINTGDTFNDFRKTRAYFARLQELVGVQTQVRYLAGNHDMVRGTDYDELEHLVNPLYLHNRLELLPGTNIALIGNNGWYDYSFVPEALGVDTDELIRWKKAFWIDGVIEQPVSDRARMNTVLEQIEAQLRQARGQRVLLATHFVPRVEFLNPAMLQSPVGGKVAAYLGSERLGQLLQRYHVEFTAFGHLHRRDEPRMLDGTEFIHRPVGYGTKRRHEWVSADFMTEWRRTLQVIEL